MSLLQTFVFVMVHLKNTAGAIVGLYMFEPIAVTADDPKVLQVIGSATTRA